MRKFFVIVNLFLLFRSIQTEKKRNLKTKSIEDMILDYEDEKNSMIAITYKEDEDLYGEFYDEYDNGLVVEQSMNMIFFGPSTSFLRLDPESIMHILVYTKKQNVPISRALLIWDILTDGKTAAYLQGREYLALGSLLNFVPEEDLYYVNFGDSSVLKYFSSYNMKLNKRRLGILVAAYKRYYGDKWYVNSYFINELGYLLCGFPSYELQKIPPRIFTEINVDILAKLGRCNVNQTKTLYNVATHHDAYGEPYYWTSHEVMRLNLLFTCIPLNDISILKLEAIAGISAHVMKAIPQEKLEYFTKEQILRMNTKTRRVYILRMQLKTNLDASSLARSKAVIIRPFCLLLSVIIIVTGINYC